MPEIVYAMGTVLSLICAVMLLRGYFRNRLPLLLWSALCFVGLSANNALLFLDRITVPEIDLSVFRGLTALVALALLVYGLISEAS